MTSFSSASLSWPKPGPPSSSSRKMRPQPLVLDLLLQAADIGLDMRVRRAHGVREHVLERLDLLLTELLDPVELLLEIRISREVPRHTLGFCPTRLTTSASTATTPCGEAMTGLASTASSTSPSSTAISRERHDHVGQRVDVDGRRTAPAGQQRADAQAVEQRERARVRHRRAGHRPVGEQLHQRAARRDDQQRPEGRRRARSRPTPRRPPRPSARTVTVRPE